MTMAAFARRLITKPKSLRLSFNQTAAPLSFNLARSLSSITTTTTTTTNSSPPSATGILFTNTGNKPQLPSMEEIMATDYGRDHKYWKIFMITRYMSSRHQSLNEDLPRDQIVDEYLKVLATVLQSEEEAKKKMYSVSTRHQFFFVCEVPFETAVQLQGVPGVAVVAPVSESDVKREDYAETGEPFVNGKAVEYDPIYHKAMMRKYNSFPFPFHRSIRRRPPPPPGGFDMQDWNPEAKPQQKKRTAEVQTLA